MKIGFGRIKVPSQKCCEIILNVGKTQLGRSESLFSLVGNFFRFRSSALSRDITRHLQTPE